MNQSTNVPVIWTLFLYIILPLFLRASLMRIEYFFNDNYEIPQVSELQFKTESPL